MNLTSLLGVGSFTDETCGGPPQKVLKAYYALLGAIHIADLYNNTVRSARLNALKVPWTSKAEMIWFFGGQDATDYANGLAAEVNAALAVND